VAEDEVEVVVMVEVVVVMVEVGVMVEKVADKLNFVIPYP
jgi:hypothetical protein